MTNLLLVLADAPPVSASVLQIVGTACFGAVIGWFLYHVNRHRIEGVELGDIVTVIAAVGGSAVTALFPAGTDLFASYGIGLAAGFFGYFVVLLLLVRASIARQGAFDWEWFLDGRRRDPGAGFGYGPSRPLGPRPMGFPPPAPPPPPPAPPTPAPIR
jgi:hypothetical protein